ncbi:hypothetical protein BU24DRAFT_200488 [Aaosphaeria arxii CBS 175.79]|uniref:Uncharacterized protein n=1 Tax=Aaosphaeria arxii CBS 175.79 TaxID=1450172 RepID=A0A6A5XTW9_9PLEO|nr:uncharacterized protein BU24DRAFT_200488 [Aaosphaeria arxii CBS 175.79]KAF2016359.1 hypothetical protein BU24DRAFT_200488 [Aaosphaeria arxii CBS 175.79]
MQLVRCKYILVIKQSIWWWWRSHSFHSFKWFPVLSLSSDFDLCITIWNFIIHCSVLFLPFLNHRATRPSTCTDSITDTQQQQTQQHTRLETPR